MKIVYNEEALAKYMTKEQMKKFEEAMNKAINNLRKED